MAGVQETDAYIAGHQMSSGTGAMPGKGMGSEISQHWSLGVLTHCLTPL